MDQTLKWCSSATWVARLPSLWTISSTPVCAAQDCPCLSSVAQTLVQAARVLRAHGATTVYAMVTHGILSGDAVERINTSKLHKLIVTNSLPQTDNAKCCPKLVVLDVSFVFAEVPPSCPTASLTAKAIRRVHHGESLSMLFDYSL